MPDVGADTDEIRCEATTRSRTRPSSMRPRRRTPDRPLDGITVLDLGFAVAGPFGTQVLADLGADVIKVNATRDPWWHANHIAYGANRGKRSIGIDLKNPDGLAVLHRLVARADVVHSNMRRDALRRLHCDEESLRAVNPDIIYCHTRGFDRGPRSRLARQRPDRLLARRRHLRGRRLPTTGGDRSGASPHSATPATGSSPPSA